MRRSKGVRAGIALAMSMALMLPFNGWASADSTTAQNLSKLRPEFRNHVSGMVDQAASTNSSGGSSVILNNFFPRQDECTLNRGGNVKVNQNCLNVTDLDLQGRAQAENETALAVDPNNPRHMVAGFNDYRRGDGTCGTSYSLDGGRSWNDSTMPNGFSRGNQGNIQNGTVGTPATFGTPREYWQASGDPSVAWDSRGNAYFSCQVFNRGAGTSPNPDQSSGFLIFRSTQNDGASWDFPGRAVIINDDTAGVGDILEDKQYMAIDASTSSPFRDRIYVTWTEFTPESAFIYESFSNDYGNTFSPKKQVSPSSAPVCPAPAGPIGGCDNNQFSQPFTAPDGTLYVIYDNFNTQTGLSVPAPDNDDPGSNPGPDAAGATVSTGAAPTGVDNHFQVLLSKSTDGGNTFSAPVKVGDFFELPDCPTYQGGQDPGRACVPEKGSQNSIFRASNYPSGAVNPTRPSQIVVSYGSYINQFSRENNGCVPQGFSSSGNPLYDGVKTEGACSNKIVLSVSDNGGTTFTGTTQNVRRLPTATDLRAQQHTDQWFQWLAFTRAGKLVVSSYDRAFGDSEITGTSDITVNSSTNLSDFDTKRVTHSSMPVPTQFPDAQGAGLFWGDYAGLATAADSAIPIWSDTRQPDVFTCPGTPRPGVPPQLCNATEAGNGLLANDEDIFIDVVDLPGR